MLKENGLLCQGGRMQLIELCRYTLRQSLCDTGEYPEFMDAQYFLDLNENGGKKNG